METIFKRNSTTLHSTDHNGIECINQTNIQNQVLVFHIQWTTVPRDERELLHA